MVLAEAELLAKIVVGVVVSDDLADGGVEEVVDVKERLVGFLRLHALRGVEAGLDRPLAVELLAVGNENPERAEQVVVVGKRRHRGAGACGEDVVVRWGL
jgi:hypothetical protein